jgi:branched-chain amino acid transport system substrate-binding protein
VEQTSRHVRGRRTKWVFLLPALILLMAACQQAADTPDGDDGAAETYKIGIATGQTGYLAVTDGPTLLGFQLGVEEINAAGGIDGQYEIELDIRNTESDPGLTATTAEQLIEDEAQLILTPCDSDPSVAGGQAAQRAQIPAISLCATTPTMPEQVGEYMFSSWYGDNATGAVLADYARELGYETAYLHLSPDTQYTQKLPEYFAEAFEAAGGTVVGQDNYGIEDQDFSATTTTVANLDPAPDVFFTSTYEPQLQALLQQYQSAGIETHFFAAEGMDTPASFELPDEVIEGVVYTTAGFEEPGSPLAEFNDKYEAEHGEDPGSVFPAVGYDLAKIIEAAVTAAGTTEPTAVRDALANLEGVEGATGTITYRGTNGMPVKQVALLTVEGGEPTLVRLVTPDAEAIPAP